MAFNDRSCFERVADRFPRADMHIVLADQKTRPFLQRALLDFGAIASGRRRAQNPMVIDEPNNLRIPLAELI